MDFARRYLSGFMMNLWLADRTGEFVITSPTANVIRLSDNDEATDITLDPVSWLPIESASISRADAAHPATSEAYTLEWMKVQSMSFPARIHNPHSGDGSADIRTERILLNSGLNPEELAIKPADLKPQSPE